MPFNRSQIDVGACAEDEINIQINSFPPTTETPIKFSSTYLFRVSLGDEFIYDSNFIFKLGKFIAKTFVLFYGMKVNMGNIFGFQN